MNSAPLSNARHSIGPSNATYALERGLYMSAEARMAAVHNLVWGYENAALTLPELGELVCGRYGAELGAQFVKTMGSGLARQEGQGGIARSFAAACINYGRMDILEAMATLPSPVTLLGQPASASDWLDHLCTRVSLQTGRTVCFTLFQTAGERNPIQARSILEFAYRHQSEHPHVAMLIERGGIAGALMAQLVMEKRAELAAGKSEVPGDQADTIPNVRRRAPV